MKRILIAMELGGNWGHFARDIPIALALRERGYELLFAVRDLPMAERLLAAHRLAYRPADMPSVPLRALTPPANYAEVLLNLGYARAGALHSMLVSWLALLDHYKPDVIVADYAPTATLAARLTSRPLVAIGLGYELPPPLHPLPSIRPWDPVPVQRLVRSEATLLTAVNAVVTAFGVTPFRFIHEWLSSDPVLLTTMPELDHFGPRPGVLYLGPLFSTPQPALTLHWPGEQRPRILSYLHPHTDGLHALLNVLGESGASILCIPGASPHSQATHTRCHVYPDALDLDSLLPTTDLVITNGNLTTSTRALLAGRPVLALPHVVEQQLAARRLASLGAGLVADELRTEPVLHSLLARLWTEDSFRRCAGQFAARHADYTLAAAVARAVEVIEAAAREIVMPNTTAD